MTHIPMKGMLSLLFCLAALSGLLHAQPADTTWKLPALPPERFTRVPVQAHTRPVEIFFPGEPGPREPYIQVALLNADDVLGSNTSDLVNRLRESARQMGCDAILIQGVQTYSKQVAFGDYPEVRSHQTASALAVVYQRTLASLDTGLWIRRWEAYGPDGSLQTVRKEAVTQGLVVMEAGIFPEAYRILLEQTSPMSVVYGQEPHWKNSYNEWGNLKKRIYRRDMYLYRFHYQRDSVARIASIAVEPYGMTIVQQYFHPPLLPAYDAEGRVSSMTFTMGGTGKVCAEITYAQGLDWSRTDYWVLRENGEKERKLFSIFHTRPLAEDIRLLMQDVVVKQPQAELR